MGNVSVRPAVQRQSLIPKYGLQIGERGDRWEEEFIKNIDFSTMDNGEDWSSLFRYSKAKDFDLTALDSENVTNMDYLFDGVDGGTLRLAGLVVGPETTGTYMFRGTFDSIDFTGAKFYHIPNNMFVYMHIREALRLGTLDTSHLTSLKLLLNGVTLPVLDLTNFDTSNITDMYGMFENADIGEVIGLKDLDFSNVTDASYMFNYYKGPYSLDLSGIKFPSLEKAYYMFSYINTKAMNNRSNFTLNLSNCYFPALTDARGMFYMSNPYQDEWNDYGKVDLITDGMVIKSLGLEVGQMFGYFRSIDNKGLDLSFLKDAKIAYAPEMFYYAQLGLTDFTMLDFSEARQVAYVFRGIKTPLIHVKTLIGLKTDSCDNFLYDTAADEIILELTTTKNVSSVRYMFWVTKDQNIIIQNSDIYATSWYNFIWVNKGIINLTIKDSTFHVGSAGSFEYFAPNYNVEGGRIDMSGLVVDGQANLRYAFGDPPHYEEVWLPETGIKVYGSLDYLCRGHSVYDPSTQTSSYVCTKMYNVDKLDITGISTLSWVFEYTNIPYDLTAWDTKNITRIYYLIRDCNGDFNLSNWDTSKVEHIEIGGHYKGHLDVSNWDTSNVNYVYGLYLEGGSIDFDGWHINKNQEVTNCYFISGGSEDSIIYMPDTIYKPDSYTGLMFGGNTPSQYYPAVIVDVYTNATSLEEQGWSFYHLYSVEEPWGYRIHWGSTHEEFLNAVEEQKEQEGGD